MGSWLDRHGTGSRYRIGPDINVRFNLRTITRGMMLRSDRLVKQLDTATKLFAIRAGGYVKKIAMRKFKTQPQNVHAPPGHAPYKHGRQSGRKQVHNSIMYGFDTRTRSVVIGPSAMFGPNLPEVARRLEHGGKLPRAYVQSKEQPLRIGDWAGIREWRPTDRVATRRHGIFLTKSGARQAVYRVKLKTARMVERAEKMRENWWGQKIETIPDDKDIFMQARPFMEPSAEAAAPYLAGFYEEAFGNAPSDSGVSGNTWWAS